MLRSKFGNGQQPALESLQGGDDSVFDGIGRHSDLVLVRVQTVLHRPREPEYFRSPASQTGGIDSSL